MYLMNISDAIGLKTEKDYCCYMQGKKDIM